MSGESYLENTAEFYAPILDWIKKFTENYKKDIQFNVSLQYYNTSSSRSILDILRLIKEHENKGNKVSVNWFHTGEDPEVYEEVEDYRLETGLNIQLCLEEE